MSQIGDYEETIEVVPLFLPIPQSEPEETPISVPQEAPEKVEVEK